MDCHYHENKKEDNKKFKVHNNTKKIVVFKAKNNTNQLLISITNMIGLNVECAINVIMMYELIIFINTFLTRSIK